MNLRRGVPLYTYDGDTDVLYVLLGDEPEAAIRSTVELSDRIHVDFGQDGDVVGIEVLYARAEGIDLSPSRSGTASESTFRAPPERDGPSHLEELPPRYTRMTTSQPNNPGWNTSG